MSPVRAADPDVDIAVSGNQMTIRAERSERKQSGGRSEFSYGSFMRTVTLSSGFNADDVKASYDSGIPTVDVTVPDQAAAEVKHVAVQSAG